MSLYNNTFVYTVIISVGRDGGHKLKSKMSKYTQEVAKIDNIKQLMLDIKVGDITIVRGYRAIDSYSDEQTPDFFKGGKCSFDIVVAPPTEQHDFWSLCVFANRKTMDLLQTAVTYSSSDSLYAITNMSNRTDRIYQGNERDFRAELGFLRGLLGHNRKYGFVLKNTHYPASDEMMSKVFGQIHDTLVQGVRAGEEIIYDRMSRHLEVLV